MSTEIKEIKGTWHKDVNGSFEVTNGEATIHLNRFYNGKELGSNLQLTIQQNGKDGKASYIHLTKEQCNNLARTLLNSFDRDIYPSE